MSELNRLPAAQAFAYATACLEREATELVRQIELFLTPAEAFAGGKEIQRHLRRQVQCLLGALDKPAIDPREAAAVAEIERELAELYPWYSDPERLNEVWRTYGKLGRQMLPA